MTIGVRYYKGFAFIKPSQIVHAYPCYQGTKTMKTLPRKDNAKVESFSITIYKCAAVYLCI